jgi:hypothetical protein
LTKRLHPAAYKLSANGLGCYVPERPMESSSHKSVTI